MTLQRKTPMKRTAMKRGGPPKRKPMKNGGRSPNEFPEETRMAVRRRSGGRCEVESSVCTGEAAHFHHRKLRRHKDQREVNCLHACSPCHTHIHGNVGKAKLMGWLVSEWDDPATVPVKRGSGGR